MVADDVYHPPFPSVPVKDFVEVGGGRAIWKDANWAVSTFPALSEDENSTECVPSIATADGPAYGVQIPASIRNWVALTPVVTSDAVRVTVTAETYHGGVPEIPPSEYTVDGGVVSTVVN